MNLSNAYMVNPGWAALLSDLGIDRTNILRRAGQPDDMFARGPTGLTPREYFALWDAIAAEANDPALPVRIGQVISAEVFDPPLFAAICSPNLGTAARRIAQHKRLIGPLRMAVSETPDGLTLEYIWPEADPAPPAVLILTELVFWTALARLATRYPVCPVRVEAPVVPEAPQAFADYFGTPVEKAIRQAITFAAEDTLRPFLTANPQMWEFFEPELRKRLAELDAEATIRERVRSALLELLPAGQASIEAVAQKLAISSRTLQRRLTDEQTTFQKLLNQTREALARHYLGRSNMPATEIAFLLGYEDPNSFYRAFRDWTGQTPERVREATI